MYSVILISNFDRENNTYYYDFCNDGKYYYGDGIGFTDHAFSPYGQRGNTYCPNGYLFGVGVDVVTDNDTITFTHNPNNLGVSRHDTKIYHFHSGVTITPFLKFPFANNFSDYETVTSYPMSLEQIECLLKSLPDWYGDYNSHYISINIRYSIQENEESNQKLQQLIQMANDKGWTVYENYNS